MKKRDFETYQKRFRDFEILPKFSETHVFRGTIRHPSYGPIRVYYSVQVCHSLKVLLTQINRVLFLTRPVLFECQNKHSLNTAYTAISRKAVGKNVHATIPKGNI